MQVVQSLHNLKVLIHAQRKKLSMCATPCNGNATDATATSTDATSDLNHDCNPMNAPSSIPLVETVMDDNSSLNSPSVPDLRVPHPLSDANSHMFPQMHLKLFPISAMTHLQTHHCPYWPTETRPQKCLGSAFNLKVFWSTGVSTWEPTCLF